MAIIPIHLIYGANVKGDSALIFAFFSLTPFSNTRWAHLYK